MEDALPVHAGERVRRCSLAQGLYKWIGGRFYLGRQMEFAMRGGLKQARSEHEVKGRSPLAGFGAAAPRKEIV